ncbi:hypothetical protein, partial [Rhodovulum sulfidophilum]|uniref:hypothetical protein n=1 Tax=Rhodovulum sulfidophilum TaxID=35806 RepID=UPI001F240CB7
AIIRPPPKFNSERFLKLCLIGLASKGINHPNHGSMEKSAFSSLLQPDGGVLDFDHETIRDLDIRNV